MIRFSDEQLRKIDVYFQRLDVLFHGVRRIFLLELWQTHKHRQVVYKPFEYKCFSVLGIHGSLIKHLCATELVQHLANG